MLSKESKNKIVSFLGIGTLKPHIKRYQMDEKNPMINLKPIYINFEEEKQ